MLKEIRAIQWSGDKLHLIDQTLLPTRHEVLALDDWRQVVSAIKDMRVRGAPALGMTAAYALAMAAREVHCETRHEFLERLGEAAKTIVEARPTAVNMAWAVKRLMALAESEEDFHQVPRCLISQAEELQREDEEANRTLGRYGAELMPSDGGVLTHCNTGALATAGYGTALGVIRAAWEAGKRFHVFNTETRPWLQGARLTSWELDQMQIPNTLIVDSAAGMMMARGEIRCVVLGADRIAANGDVANKVGTYTLAVLAHENSVPFYVAAPTSTIDLDTPSGDEIVIEERPSEEVVSFAGMRTAPPNVGVFNPAFDVTPHRYISAIITERGVLREPYGQTLQKAVCGDG
jgi:methylthioribose-1-phosphate isomerase